jgi:hypothetical protein
MEEKRGNKRPPTLHPPEEPENRSRLPLSFFAVRPADTACCAAEFRGMIVDQL